MNPIRAFCWLSCLAMPLLSGCLTLESPGHAQPMTAVVPSLAVAHEGWHPNAAVAVGRVDQGSGSAEGTSLNLQGGTLWQSGLEPDFALGFFGAAQGRVLLSQIQVTGGSAEGTLTSGQQSALSFNSFDFVGDADLRAGVVAKFDRGTFSIYGHGVVQYEGGPYFDYRTRVDGIGHYYNVSSHPVTFGVGPGVDLSLGKTGSWALGLTVEPTIFFTHSQSYVETDEQSDGTNVDVTRSGGSDNAPVSFSFKPHLDISNYSMFICWSGQFSEGTSSFSAGVSYRW